jgi:hypothetical protein
MAFNMPAKVFGLMACSLNNKNQYDRCEEELHTGDDSDAGDSLASGVIALS